MSRPPLARACLGRAAGCLLLAALATPALVPAQVPPAETHPALGAPDDPRVPVTWNRFYDVAGLHRVLRALEAAYPGLSEIVLLGQSVEGRDILGLRVGNEADGDPDARAAMYIDGNIHGNEVQAGETVLYTAWYLLEMYDRVDAVRKLVDERTFYLVPTINPDGRDHWFHDAVNMNQNRGGRVPVDNDGDGRFDEDETDDLDGDGHITQMRIKDPWGRYKPDPDYPDYLMAEVDRDERGEYTLLGWEGADDDGDGELNEDGPGGYDPNRNWPWRWQPEAVQYGARDYPFSLPESRAVADFFMSRPNIAATQSYHNRGGMILRPPGQEEGGVHPDDERLAAFIGDRGQAMIPFYHSYIVWKDLYTVWGGEFEWFYGGRGIISFTNELWTEDNYFREETPRGSDGDRNRARFLRYLLQNQGLVPWHPVEHPQYGAIEVGGTTKNFGRVPPSFLLEEELHRNMAFTLYHASCMPLLALGEVTTQALGGGVTRVRVPVENHGVIPTRIGHDVKEGITPRNVVALTGLTVVAGGVADDPRLDRVTWQRGRGDRVLVEAVPGLGRTVVEFLVTGSGSGRVTASAARGGTVSAPVQVR